MSPEDEAAGGWDLTFFDGATVKGVGCDHLLRGNATKRECVPRECTSPFVSVEKEPLGECLYMCEMPCPLPLWPEESWDGLLYASVCLRYLTL